MFITPWQEEIDTNFPAWRNRLGLQAKYADSLYLSDIEKLLRAAGSKSPDNLALHIFIQDPGLADQKQFLCSKLPKFLTRLRKKRNPAEHGGDAPLADVKALRREALGIGCEGVLPRLARLKRRLIPEAERTRRLGRGSRRLLPGSQT